MQIVVLRTAQISHEPRPTDCASPPLLSSPGGSLGSSWLPVETDIRTAAACEAIRSDEKKRVWEEVAA